MPRWDSLSSEASLFELEPWAEIFRVLLEEGIFVEKRLVVKLGLRGLRPKLTNWPAIFVI